MIFWGDLKAFFLMMIEIEKAELVRRMPSGTGLLAIIVLIFWATISFAQQGGSQSSQRWVSDQFEVTMRSGKDNRKAIVRMLPSGANIELLEEDAEAGYSRVRTPGGAEGWVLNRYLMKIPPARKRLPDLEARLRKSQEKRSELEREIRDLSKERSDLQSQSSKLEKSGSSLQGELDEVRRLSSSVIEVNDSNKQLRRRLIENEQLLDELKSENSRLAARSNREWFVIGALVVIFGILIGLILPRIRWRKKSGWGEL
jgi:SH3 domain protein